MSEEQASMGEGPQRPVGERRRRREAARAAQRQAEQAGISRPSSRRELRWREAEEAAHLEAIATGELPVGEVQEALDRAAVAPPVPPEVAGTTAADVARSAASAQSAPPAASPATTSASGARSRPPSRRSLRERAQDAENAPEERPSERTATARRPVVRTPTTAQGIRVLDATGQLTGIQPVVRPDEPSSGRPAQPGAVEREHFTVDLDVPTQTARDALAGQSVPAAGLRDEVAGPVVAPTGAAKPADAAEAGHDGERADVVEPAGSVRPTGDARDEDDGDDEDLALTLRPQWVAISSVSGVSPDEATSAVPSDRSVRSRAEDLADTAAPPAAEEPPTARGNPAATLVKVVVLAVVAVIIGALIWLLATEALGDDTLGDALAPITWTITDHHEETSAR